MAMSPWLPSLTGNYWERHNEKANQAVGCRA